MLEFALSGLLLLQTASGSPGVVPGSSNVVPGSSTSGSTASPRPTATPRPTARGRGPSPSPTTQPTPTPTPRPSNDALVVVNKSDNSISVFDAATGKLKWTAPVESGPHEAEVLADGKTVAVSDYGRAGSPGRVVALIDIATGKVNSRVDLGEGSRPHGLSALKDGRLLVTAEGKKELAVVDPRSARVTVRIPTGHDLSHMVAASPDGKIAYVTALRSGVVTEIDVPGGKVLADIPTGRGAEGLDVTPDGREIWVANREANTISVIDARTAKVVATIKASSFPIRVRITPDGKRALVSFTGSGDVGVFDVATRTEVKRIPLGRVAVAGSDSRGFRKKFGSSPAPIGLLIAPDGKRAWVAAAHADVVIVLDLDALKVADAWAAGKEPDGLAGRFDRK